MFPSSLRQRLFGQRPAYAAGQALYAAAAAQARSPALYRDLGAPDTIEGRFELYLVHVAALVNRLRGEGPRARETNQVLFDAFLKGLDDALREMGVGDLSVGKKMRRLGEAFYGRAKGYAAALDEAADPHDLPSLIGRTVFAEAADPAVAAAPLAAYVRRLAHDLAGQDAEALLAGRVRFPAVGEAPA
jgi:cytochrome b pre-mRNA-processing protein 3